MKITILATMFSLAVLSLNSCDLKSLFPDEPITIKPNVTINFTNTFSHTENGINFKYTVNESPHNVGDNLKVLIDSDNEEKPFVRMMVKGEEVLYTSDLPAEGVYETSASGEHTILFQIYNPQEELEYVLQTSFNVK